MVFNQDTKYLSSAWNIPGGRRMPRWGVKDLPVFIKRCFSMVNQGEIKIHRSICTSHLRRPFDKLKHMGHGRSTTTDLMKSKALPEKTFTRQTNIVHICPRIDNVTCTHWAPVQVSSLPLLFHLGSRLPDPWIDGSWYLFPKLNHQHLESYLW